MVFNLTSPFCKHRMSIRSCVFTLFFLLTAYHVFKIAFATSVFQVNDIESFFSKNKDYSAMNRESRLSAKFDSLESQDNSWVDKWIAYSDINQKSIDILHAQEGLSSANGCFNVVYSWANGSNPVYKHYHSLYEGGSPVYQDEIGKERQYTWAKRTREHDELRYSIRSIRKYLSGFKPHFHIISTDFVKADSAEDALQMTSSTISSKLDRIYIIPLWMNMSKIGDGMSIHFPSQFYNPADALPVFNSRAYETQLANIPMRRCSHADAILYSNDDMFLGNFHSPFDWVSPLGGLNLNLDTTLDVMYEPIDRAALRIGPNDGDNEYASLRYSNYLLAERFGKRTRAYVAHFTRVQSRDIIRELGEVFPEDMLKTASMRFRGEGFEINTGFLHHHLVMERHREVMLFSYIQLVRDLNGDGYISREEVERLIEDLDSGVHQPDRVRNVLAKLKKEQANTHMLPLRNQFKWSSQIGALPYGLNLNSEIAMDSPYAWRYRIGYELDGSRECNRDILYNKCLRKPFRWRSRVSSFDFADRLARIHPACGDCLLTIVSQQSKSLGLEDYLPPQEHPERGTVVNLLHRYSYTLSAVNGEFVMATSAEQAKDEFERILAHNKVDQICVNDDVESEDPIEVNAMSMELRSFMRKLYPAASEYEVDI